MTVDGESQPHTVSDALNLKDYQYALPPELIAQDPTPDRTASRLLVLRRANGALEDLSFGDIPELLLPGDLLVLNDTRVFPARLRARRPTGGKAELLLLKPVDEGLAWRALGRPGRALRPGGVLEIAAGVVAHVLDAHSEDGTVVEFRRGAEVLTRDAVLELCESVGETPLPPYIHRDVEDPRAAVDRERYQTVYARERGSAAAPTAGLHFTTALLDEIRRRGVEVQSVTLHVGIGTFKPLTAEELAAGTLHAEEIEISPSAGAALLRARSEGRRIVSVGTTTVRALESWDGVAELPYRSATKLFIRPCHEFRWIDALVTNFHLPGSSLLVLVSALAGRSRILDSYRHAVEKRYRFYSYGDAMMII